MRRTTIVCLIAVMMLSGCGSAVNKTVTSNVQATKNVQQITNQFIMGGKIAANEEANIASKISGRVSEISVDVGSKVKQGDIIIKLDAKDLQAQVDQAQAAVNTAQASLANAKNSTRPEQVIAAQASVDSATQSYEVAKKNYDRTKALVDSGAAAQAQLDTAQQTLASADAQLKSAQQQLNILNNGPTRSSIEVYEAQVAQAEAALKTAQAALSNAVITAPIDGIVNAKKINVGELASPGTTLVSVVNDSELYVNVYAPLEVVNNLKEEQEVAIKVSELPDKNFKGKVAVINSKVNDQSRNILVKVSIEDPNAELKSGMFAEIGLIK